ncbi:MAG: zinc ribbon domain-containing protein [Chloroflexi bacterium]|nr:zinc ribbon domain-containing protein [Chloroflexota bacterium]
MPIYEYFCLRCNRKFELLRRLSEAGEAACCPKCQAAAQRVLSTFCSLSRDDSGQTVPTGGSSCGGCSSTACGTCGS